MFTYNDTREAQRMWEQKFNNAGREGITLSDGKRKGLFRSIAKVHNTKKAHTGMDGRFVANHSRV